MHYEEFNHFCWSKPVFEKSLKKILFQDALTEDHLSILRFRKSNGVSKDRNRLLTTGCLLWYA